MLCYDTFTVSDGGQEGPSKKLVGAAHGEHSFLAACIAQ